MAQLSGVPSLMAGETVSESDRRESLVARPQASIGCQQCRSQQLRVDVPDAQAEQMPLLDQSQHLDVRGDRRLREVVKQTKNLAASHEVTERELPGHPGVRQDVAVLEEPYELGVTGA